MHDLSLITTIAAAFTAAWVLGLLTQWLRLSPIVGYLLAGIVIGPKTPGFVGNVHLAQQLAEVGVILLMFGVGLHFNLGELLAVRKVAVPGAVGQSLVATLLGIAVAASVGWGFKTGIVLGVAMSVASTVVLIRVLTDNRLLDTSAGHAAVGWLIVEDVLTVVVLVVLPVLGTGGDAALPARALWQSLAVALLKLAALVVILLLAGVRIIPWVMVRVARLRSRELFTLTVLVMAVAVAVGSANLFGASMALGAFLAGMVVGQSAVSHQAAADALPLRDAFSVLFFVSVGMLFDPSFVYRHPGLLLGGLAVVMVGKPLAAMALVALVGYPPRTALVVALGLAQVGEFSFILADLGVGHGLLNETGRHLIVATALVSITLNPVLFRALGPMESFLKGRPALWNFLNRKALAREDEMNREAGAAIEAIDKPLAVVVGYGPVGRAVDSILRESGRETVIVDLNPDTIRHLRQQGRLGVYGDAYTIELMHQALPRATHLVITLPHSENRNHLVVAAKLINPRIKVFVRARYLAEREDLEQVGADGAVYEEAEAAVALARLVLLDQGADKDTVRRESTRVRQEIVEKAGTA